VGSSEDFAAAKRKEARENNCRVLAVLVRAGEAGLLPGVELAELAGIPPRTATRALGRLIGLGLARRNGLKRAWATTAGYAEFGAGTPALSLLPALRPALEYLPAEVLRAFTRLQLAAVPARWHLADTYASGWGGFVAAGLTKTCKTSIAKLVCRVYGLDELQAIRSLPHETPGSVLGRRIRDRASQSGYRLQVAPQLELSYVCLDELERAKPGVKAAAGALLLGTTRAELEGEVCTIRPLIYITLNKRSELLQLDDAYVRRSVVIDTTPLRELLVDADLHMVQLFDGSGRIPHLPLDRIKPPLPALPPDLWRLLRDELRHGLTEDGWALSDTESLARIALGWAALTNSDDLEQAVLVVAFDALCCASTLGHAVAGYADRLASRLGAGALTPDPDAAEDQRRQLVTRRLSRELQRATERDRLVEERGRLERMLDEAIDQLDQRRLKDCSPQHRVEAYGITERLREVRDDITSARTQEGALAAAEVRARDPLGRAGRLHRQIERERELRRLAERRVVPELRSRSPDRAPRRDLAGFIRALLPRAHGADLESLEQQTRQLEQPPPMSQAEQRRHIQELAMEQVTRAAGLEERGRLEQTARLFNPYG
jgi:hypothetical protein